MDTFTTAEEARKMTKTARCSTPNNEHLQFVLNEVGKRAMMGDDYLLLDKTCDNKPFTILTTGTINAIKELGYSVGYTSVRVGDFYSSSIKISW